MFEILQKIKKYALLIALTICALVGAIAGASLWVKDASSEVTASAESGTFSMVNGARVSIVPNRANLAFEVYLTQDIYDKLFEETKESKFLFWTTYDPNDYYLQITRHDPRESTKENDFSVFYHVDPEHSDFSSVKWSKTDEELRLLLPFPFDENYSTEYVYTCSFGIRVSRTEKIGRYYFTFNEFVEQASTNTVTRSVEYVATEALKYDTEDLGMTAEQIAWLNHLAGIDVNEGTFEVNVVYQTMNGFGNFEKVTETVIINSLYVACPTVVYGSALQILGASGISAFNCVYSDTFGEKVVLQADGYNYAYDDLTGKGTLTIAYRDFEYSDFCLFVKDNDLTDGVNLSYSAYTSDVEVNETNGTVTMRFSYAEIVSYCHSSFSWIFNLTKDNITVANGSENVAVTVGDDELVVTFPYTSEDELKDVAIVAVAEIVPDYECSVDLVYTILTQDGYTIADEEVTKRYTMMYSEYVSLCYFETFSESKYYETVTAALDVESLNGQEYFMPCGVSGVQTANGFKLEVEYEYRVLLAVVDRTNDDVHFVACAKNSLIYTYDDLDLTPLGGYRLSTLTTDDRNVAIEFNEFAVEDLTVTLNVSAGEKLIVPIYATYTDFWYLKIEYFETYKATPFALKKSMTAKVKIADYDLMSLTIEDVKELLGKKDMGIAGMVIPDEKVNAVPSDSSTYTATVTYGHAALAQIDSSGNKTELKIPLTSFSEWCDSFGEDWSILYLNTDEHTYFRYSNDVARKDLYGFFSVAVFDERVSNLNSWFANNTGDGIMTIYAARETKGSSIYEFFGALNDNILTSVLLGAMPKVGMMFCELFNADDAIYYSYYFYLDGSSKEGYIARNGADDAYDTDGAAKNTIDDIGTWLDEQWKSFTNSEFVQQVQTVFKIVGLLIVIGLLVWFFIWLFGKLRKE